MSPLRVFRLKSVAGPGVSCSLPVARIGVVRATVDLPVNGLGVMPIGGKSAGGPGRSSLNRGAKAPHERSVFAIRK